MFFLVLFALMAISGNNAMNINVFDNGNFMQGFNEEMEKFTHRMDLLKDEMANQMEKMENDRERLTNRIEEIQNMNATDLAMKIEVNTTGSVYHFGGCYCMGVECECCGIVDELSTETICFTMNYSEGEMNIPVMQKNETLGQLSVLDIKDICTDRYCLHFYNVMQKMNSLKGCMDLKLVDSDVQARIGCFRMDKDNQKFSRNLMSVRTGNATVFYNQMNQEVNATEMEGLDMNSFVDFNKWGSFNSLNNF